MKKTVGVLLLLCVHIFVFAQKEKMVNYTIKAGDKIYRIAKDHNITVEQIKKYNPTLKDEAAIKIGQVIKLPVFMANKEKTTTVVQKQEVKNVAEKTVVAAPKSKTISHTVEKGQTLYSIARTYGTTVAEIESLNKIKKEDGLKLGQILKVSSASHTATASLPTKKVVEEKVEEVNEEPSEAFLDYNKNDAQLIHTVINGQTASEIAKIYNLRVKEIYLINQLPMGSKLYDEQVLTVGSFKPKSTIENTIKTPVKEVQAAKVQIEKEAVFEPKKEQPIVEKKTEQLKYVEETRPVKKEIIKEVKVVSNTEAQPSEYTSVFNSYEADGYKRKTFRGIAAFIPAGTVSNTNLAYYNFAPVGSIIKVTNLMSKKSVYVKVIDKISDKEMENEVILKVSQEMANELKVKEDKYLVEVTGFSK